MKFTEQEIERQRQANIEHNLRATIQMAIARLEWTADHPFSSAADWCEWCERMAEDLRRFL